MAEGDVNYLYSNNTDCNIEIDGVKQRASVAVDPVISGSREGLTGYIAGIASDHAYIHKGMAFNVYLDISLTGVYSIGFKTPSLASGIYIHWRPAKISSVSNYVKAKLYISTSFTGGTTQTPKNMNHNYIASTSSSMQSVSIGVTPGTLGDVVGILGIGSGGNVQSRAGGGVGANEELVLLPNTSYVLQLTPGGNTDVTGTLFWYEETGYTG